MSDYYVPSDAEIRSSATRLGAWSEDAYDRWLARHDDELRERIAQAIETHTDHVYDSWSDALALAVNVVRGQS